MQITITEALADVKTIGKRIDKKKEFIGSYLLRQERVKDPLEKDGGSVKAIVATLQSIRDLETRLIRIRSGIQSSNLNTLLTIGGRTMCVSDWLTWRKEVAPMESRLLSQVRQTIDKNREQLRAKGVTVASGNAELKPDDVIVNLDEGQLAKESEQLEEVLGTLDGKLSLINATTTIELA